MAYRIELTPRALRDLTNIFDRINAHSSRAAHVWYQGLRAAIRSLRTDPKRCPATPEDPNLRHLLYGNRHIYRVIYRFSDKHKKVEVLHIRHGARDEFSADELT